MTESSIAGLFLKDPKILTADDRARIIAAFRDYCARMKIDPKAFDPKTGAPKKRRKAKADPRQIDLEELIAKESSK
jgi:hypothetical protein